MADISYLDAVELIRQSYGKGTLTWTETSQALSNAGITSDNYLNFFENSGVFDVVKNADGTARNITWRTAESISDPLNQISTQINSNVGSSVVSESAYVEIPGDLTIESGASSGTFSAGAKIGSKIATGTRFVFGEVAPAVGAAMVGCALGKTIDGAIYDIGTAMGLNPPWSLNPETWGSLLSDIDENDPERIQWRGKALQFLLGVDPDTGTTTAYMDENAVAAYAQWLNEQGLFADGELEPTKTSIVTTDTITSGDFVQMPLSEALSLLSYTSKDRNVDGVAEAYGLSTPCLFSAPAFGAKDTMQPSITLSYISDGYNGNPTNIVNNGFNLSPNLSDYQVNPYASQGRTVGFYVTNYGLLATYSSSGLTVIYRGALYAAGTNVRGVATPYLYASKSGAIPGTGDQTGAVLPDTSTWLDPTSIGQYLASYFPTIDPDWSDKKVTQTVPQPDGSQKTYTYIPVPFVNINDKTDTNPSTGDFGQVDPEITPNTDPVTNPIVKNIPKITTNPVQSTPNVPSNPPDTGSGDTPTPVIPTESGSNDGVWSVYNPSDAVLKSFGEWLWSSNFIDQLKKMFSNPMDAIIGIHQVYAPVTNGPVVNIKCGYLDSGIASDTVAKRYSTIDCGTKYLKEYFGNVFDYDPYTQVHMYLPFIGIVPLKTSEVMRGRLTVIYHVDVLTGACLAEIRVKRDDAGGTLYTFSGSCAISLPFTSGSYMNGIVDAAMVGINSIGAIASGFSGNLLATTMFAGGAIANTFKEHTNVQKSGSFSGNPGAMGIKTPYLIITRPQTELADNYQHFVGIPSNATVTLGSVSGYARVKSTHVESITNASEEEKREIEMLLKSGVLIQ